MGKNAIKSKKIKLLQRPSQPRPRRSAGPKMIRTRPIKKNSKVKKAAFCLPKWLGVRGSRGGLVQLGGGIATPLQITLPDPWPARRMCDFLDRLIPFWLDLGWPARGLYHKKPCGGPLWNRKAFANKEKKGLALMLFAATACSNNHFSSFSLQCR